MSVAEENTGGQEKKSSLCEDSSESENEDEKKPLLRRISTSKCVGRLEIFFHSVVSNVKLRNCLYSQVSSKFQQSILKMLALWKVKGRPALCAALPEIFMSLPSLRRAFR
ncbi:unnamed protein product [Leptidea sinapis]|uniref:Uncharacterized protein n=1 Tax=Leptidea sinapis TaxID=189913 RepID=A0A5E4QW54_9NEOP|nr:unnamed protein product [Leptidea sinapis]